MRNLVKRNKFRKLQWKSTANLKRTHFMKPGNSSNLFFLLFLSIFICVDGFSVCCSEIDSVIVDLHGDAQFIDPNSPGVTLIKQEKYEEANQLLTNEIVKNESNSLAYFNRGVVRWNMGDASNACRDWSAVLALGDTATFKLLDKNCHGSMVIDEDTIASSQYHRMWTPEKKDARTLSSNSKASSLVEEMPEFPGGIEALLNYLQKNIKYPSHARDKNVQGRVYINFIVGKKGKILFPYVARGIGGGCDEEALRVIRNMPHWKPGKQNGKPVAVRFNLPVKFSLR